MAPVTGTFTRVVCLPPFRDPHDRRAARLTSNPLKQAQISASIPAAVTVALAEAMCRQEHGLGTPERRGGVPFDIDHDRFGVTCMWCAIHKRKPALDTVPAAIAVVAWHVHYAARIRRRERLDTEIVLTAQSRRAYGAVEVAATLRNDKLGRKGSGKGEFAGITQPITIGIWRGGDARWVCHGRSNAQAG